MGEAEGVRRTPLQTKAGDERGETYAYGDANAPATRWWRPVNVPATPGQRQHHTERGGQGM